MSIKGVSAQKDLENFQILLIFNKKCCISSDSKMRIVRFSFRLKKNDWILGDCEEKLEGQLKRCEH